MYHSVGQNLEKMIQALQHAGLVMKKTTTLTEQLQCNEEEKATKTS